MSLHRVIASEKPVFPTSLTIDVPVGKGSVSPELLLKIDAPNDAADRGVVNAFVFVHGYACGPWFESDGRLIAYGDWMLEEVRRMVPNAVLVQYGSLGYTGKSDIPYAHLASAPLCNHYLPFDAVVSMLRTSYPGAMLNVVANAHSMGAYTILNYLKHQEIASRTAAQNMRLTTVLSAPAISLSKLTHSFDWMGVVTMGMYEFARVIKRRPIIAYEGAIVLHRAAALFFDMFGDMAHLPSGHYFLDRVVDHTNPLILGYNLFELAWQDQRRKVVGLERALKGVDAAILYENDVLVNNRAIADAIPGRVKMLTNVGHAAELHPGAAKTIASLLTSYAL